MTLLLLACTAGGTDSAPAELPPPEDSQVRDTTPDTFRIDTSFQDTASDLTPAHTVVVTHEGSWEMSPDGGPYTAMTGSLLVTEVVDGDEEAAACTLEFSLTGDAVDDGCPTCAASFEVLYYLASGDVEGCVDPDRPDDGARQRQGWSNSDSFVFYDFLNSGVWLPWYPGARVGGSIEFTWTTSYGVTVEEEE